MDTLALDPRTVVLTAFIVTPASSPPWNSTSTPSPNTLISAKPPSPSEANKSPRD